MIIDSCLKNVYSYRVSSNNLCYCTTLNQLYFNQNFVDIGIDNYNYDYLNNKLIYSKEDFTIYGNDKLKGKFYLKDTFDNKNLSIILMGDFILDYPNRFSNYYIYYLYNNECKLIDRISNLQKIYNSDNKLFTSQNLIITAYLHTPITMQLWQYYLKDLEFHKTHLNEVSQYEVNRFIGIQNGQIIVQLSNASFLFLDINTGKMLKVIQLKELFPLPSPVFYSDRCIAHLEENKIIWLNNQILLHIDLLTYEVMVIKKFYEEIREQQYRFMSNTYFKGKIYFVADYGWQYVTPSSIGVMNADTGEVIWREQLKKTGGLPEVPQVTDEKLYVRTANNELYIFEKN